VRVSNAQRERVCILPEGDAISKKHLVITPRPAVRLGKHGVLRAKRATKVETSG
jgi:hypothetical protein